MTTAVRYNGTTSPVLVSEYQLLMGRVTTFIPANPITIELHRVAIDAYARQIWDHYMIFDLTATSRMIGRYRPPLGMSIWP
jgi:hypothetical protein